MSKLNCRPGDLAVIVRSEAGNEGKVVHCLRLDAARSSGPTVTKSGKLLPPSPIWAIDRAINHVRGTIAPYCHDSYLRPLRDPGEDAQDESLSWLPVPSASKEVA